MTNQQQRPVTDLNDYQYAVEALKEVVKIKGNGYVYERVAIDGVTLDTGACAYAHPTEDAPSCIVGHLLHRHGVTIADLRTEDGFNPATDTLTDGTPASTGNAYDVAPDFGIEVNSVRNLLLTVQQQQNQGTPWGEAVAKGIADTEHLA